MFLWNNPTRVISETATLVNHVSNNSSQKVSQCSVTEWGISDHHIAHCTKKLSLLMSIRSMKNYKKEKILELLRDTDFWDYVTFTWENKAYQDFILKLSEVIELLCLSKK